MFNDIDTQRLRLKCVDKSDRDFILEEFQNDFINTYLFDQEPMSDIKEADDLIEFYTMKEPREQNRWVLIDRSNKKRIGTCGFHLWEREKKEVEIGFELMETFNGKGYMSEAVKAIIRFAKANMGVSKIRAVVYTENQKCKKLVESIGFKIVGKEEDCLFRGKKYIHDIYELEF